jgi:uncharacterized protein (TIGR03067 family)
VWQLHITTPHGLHGFFRRPELEGDDMLATALLAVVVGAPAVKDANPVQRALADLQGTWRLVGGSENSFTLTPEEALAEEQTLTFTRERLVVAVRGRTLHEFRLAVDPAKSPGHIDLTWQGGDHDGKTTHGIFARAGDRLTICTPKKFRPNASAERPGAFDSKRQSDRSERKLGLMVQVLERTKKE